MWLRWNSSIYNAPLLGNWNISTSVGCSNYKCKYCLTTWREVYLNWLSVEKKTHQLLYMCADFGLTYSRYSPSKYCKCCKYRIFFSIMTKQFWQKNFFIKDIDIKHEHSIVGIFGLLFLKISLTSLLKVQRKLPGFCLILDE